MYTHRAILEVRKTAAGEKSTMNTFNSINVYFLCEQGHINAAAASKRAF